MTEDRYLPEKILEKIKQKPNTK